MAHPRPLSPHLGIYKKQWTMIYSILHRFTGIGLCGGIMLLILWLCVLAGGESYYYDLKTLLLSPIGKIFLIMISFSFFYHLLNGIRHLCWDMGIGFDIKVAKKSGDMVIALAVLFVIIFWALAYIVAA